MHACARARTHTHTHARTHARTHTTRARNTQHERTVLHTLERVHHFTRQRRQQLGVLAQQLSVLQQQRRLRVRLLAAAAVRAAGPCGRAAGAPRRALPSRRCCCLAAGRCGNQVCAEPLAGLDHVQLLHQVDLGRRLHAF
jgi:hypothetical protein